ncbi:hypothetical protein PA598K_00153 [Paenibacillus sp. 598K]|uniref:hypothetical protein n=1 Tax=Paenibacillus sp. 598K TaxID=1117987 RepID=UPI000FF9B232|nr:hypothetical protein [Paenibacillus sp. 598K]GBF71927.1 hypothetical protein PA598K_00153 [Paenibacillus sp. 598K]
MNEGSTFKRALLLTAYSFACGLLLAVFAQMDSLLRFAFSLGALLLGIRFFRDFESLRSRITFIALAIVFYVLITIIIIMVLYAQGKLDIPEAG